METSLHDINHIIEKMEEGNLTLEQSLSHFERGITLIKHAQAILNAAEQKVEILIKNHTNETLTPYESNEE